MHKRYAVVALGLALGACATAPPFMPMPAGAPVALDVQMSAPPGAPMPITNLALGKDMKVGTSGGVVAGAVAGLSCGPWMFICVPGGILLGGLTGGTVGAVVGVTGQMSSDKATQLRERLERYRQSHDMRAELRGNLETRARRHWELGSASPSFVVRVELQGFELTSTRDEQIGLIAHVLVSVRASGRPEARQKRYEYIAPAMPLTVWMDERSDFLDTLHAGFSQQMAAQIVSELALE